MKQIFNWLRSEIIDRTFLRDGTPLINVHALGNIINEAEAKWEADCCIWKPYGKKEFIENPHTRRMFSNEPSMKNVYCNTCGKPIKISEVE